MIKQLTTYIGLFIGVYVAAYVAAYCNRGPAANMAYFCYTERPPEWVERFFYRGFYPIYILHRTSFDGRRHVWDREPPIDNPDM